MTARSNKRCQVNLNPTERAEIFAIIRSVIDIAIKNSANVFQTLKSIAKLCPELRGMLLITNATLKIDDGIVADDLLQNLKNKQSPNISILAL